jgi:hypothetical protein
LTFPATSKGNHIFPDGGVPKGFYPESRPSPDTIITRVNTKIAQNIQGITGILSHSNYESLLFNKDD